MRRLDRVASALHGFVALGAFVGGGAAIVNPVSPLGAPVELLAGSPFRTFLVPGIFLFAVLGLGNAISLWLCARGSRLRGYATGIVGVAMVGWIVVQCVVMRGVAPIHIVYFVLGALQGVMALAMLHHDDAFPMSFAWKLF